jgi:hypothetical protein
MIGSKLKGIAVLLAGVVGGSVAPAQTPAALIYDTGVGPISFAAGDLKAALQQNGCSVTDLPLGDTPGTTQSVRIILTTSDVSVPGKPSPSGLAAQFFRVKQ